MPADTDQPRRPRRRHAGHTRRAVLADVEREPGAKKPDPIVVADNVTPHASAASPPSTSSTSRSSAA